MLLEQTMYTFDTYAILVTIKDSPYQCLGEKIHWVFHKSYHLNHYITPLYYLMNQVVLPLNVFTFSIVSCFFKLYHNPTIITKQYHRLYSHRYYLKSLKEHFNPNDFLYCFRSYKYSSFIMESIMQDCFTLILLTVTPPKVNTKLKVDQREYLSN